MFGSAKAKVKIISTIFAVLFFTGAAGMYTRAAEEKNDSFTLSYQGRDTDIVISLTDCICEYDSGDFKIYTRYIEEELTESYDRHFPHRAQAAYLWTPDDSRQIFPLYDYGIDEISGSAYFLFRGEKEDFIGLYQYTAGKSYGSGKGCFA